MIIAASAFIKPKWYYFPESSYDHCHAKNGQFELIINISGPAYSHPPPGVIPTEPRRFTVIPTEPEGRVEESIKTHFSASGRTAALRSK
jgi:hypothetical protein